MRYLGLLCVMFAAFPAAAEITVDLPWAPPSLSQPNGVGFMGLTSDTDDALINVTSDCCAAVELHTHRIENDVIRMRKVDKIMLPANQEVLLRPGGYHIMLIGLKEPMLDGSTVPVTLQFRHSAPKPVVLQVDRARLLDRLKSPKH